MGNGNDIATLYFYFTTITGWGHHHIIATVNSYPSKQDVPADAVPLSRTVVFAGSFLSFHV